MALNIRLVIEENCNYVKISKNHNEIEKVHQHHNKRKATKS